ncbi:hypothetical protein FPQ18DRAFT_387448 [Pyronema domesticum]|nr:hypothetical protein FPQ18DRAFT_387448 [Pyronema domesticum]
MKPSSVISLIVATYITSTAALPPPPVDWDITPLHPNYGKCTTTMEREYLIHLVPYQSTTGKQTIDTNRTLETLEIPWTQRSYDAMMYPMLAKEKHRRRRSLSLT